MQEEYTALIAYQKVNKEAGLALLRTGTDRNAASIPTPVRQRVVHYRVQQNGHALDRQGALAAGPHA